MNAKLAKKLRRIAMGMTAAAEQASGREIDRVQYVKNTKTGVISVSRASYKGANKALKKGIKEGISEPRDPIHAAVLKGEIEPPRL